MYDGKEAILQVEAETGNRSFVTHKWPEYPVPNVSITMETLLIKLLL